MAVSLANPDDKYYNCVDTGDVNYETVDDEDEWLFRSVKRLYLLIFFNSFLFFTSSSLQ